MKSHNPLRGFVSRYPGEEWRQKRWTWRVGPTMLWQHIGLEIKHYPDFTPPERWDTATMPFFGAPYRVRHVDMPVEGIQTYSPTEAKAIATELLTRGFGIRFNEAMRIMEDFPADELINYSAEAPSRDVSVSVYRNPTLKLKRRLLK